MKYRRVGLGITVFIIALAVAGRSVPGAAESTTPASPDAVLPLVSVLEKDGNPRMQPGPPPPYLDVLEKIGLIVGYPDARKVAPLRWDVMRRYHMLVVIRPPRQQGYSELADEAAREQEELVDRFLEEGGGVLVFAGVHVGDTLKDHEHVNAWLGKYDIQYEWAVVDDEAHTYKNPPAVPWQFPEYLWTENVGDSPIAAGVRTVFMPHVLFWVPSVRPVRPGKDWQVVLSSEPTASTWALPTVLGGQNPQRVQGSEKKGAVPLLAVREVGKGRLAVCGIQATALWCDLGKPAGAQVASVRGDGERSSDWLPLLRNLCLWLSEPARAAGKPGGATERVRAHTNPEYGNREPVAWDRPDISWPDSEIHRLYAIHAGPWNEAYWRETAAGLWKPYKFLVGARSAAGGGKGTVADWKRAAVGAGFAGVVFREKVLEMTPEQWDAFETECRAACDDGFMAIPGQEFTDWENNRFMRFQRRTPYPNTARLTPDKQRVKDQLSFFFDAGWPVNFPLTPKSNPNPFWAYSVYSSYPVAVYENGKRIEDNSAEWASLVDRMEYPTPLGVHLLDDPAQVAGAAGGMNLVVLAPSLRDVMDNPRWDRSSLGHGTHNTTIAYASEGPIIEAFLPLNHYRATLGDRGVPGSYRYRLVIRARSDTPMAQVELRGGDQVLRCYRPNAKRFFTVVDEQHDRQRGLWLRVVDAEGRQALATSIMVHDKMMVWYWCGDHCNALPYGQGVDRDGHPTGLGLATHVKRQYAPAAGPGGTFAEAWAYIPSGTDTSLPGLNLFGEAALAGVEGPVPAAGVWLVPDVRLWYANRDVLLTRQAVTLQADAGQYIPKEQPAINGWYPYTAVQPTEDFDVISDDIDFHRDAGQPSLQLCRGELRFKREIALSDKQVLNLGLTRLGWNAAKAGFYTADGPLERPGRIERKLGRGHYVTWPADLGHATVFALDDEFAADCAVDADGKQQGRPAFGYALGARTFAKGDVFRYAFLLMRWPVGSAVGDGLDAKVQTWLNLAGPDTGVSVTAAQGEVAGAQLYLDLKIREGAFRGDLATKTAGMRVPVRVAGLNPNWTAGVWTRSTTVFAPTAPDPDGYAWTSLDPAADAGAIFIGHLVTCDNPDVLLRALQRDDGGWDLIAHNPLERKAPVTVRGTEGGPLAGLKQRVDLAPGGEVRVTFGLSGD